MLAVFTLAVRGEAIDVCSGVALIRCSPHPSLSTPSVCRVFLALLCFLKQRVVFRILILSVSWSVYGAARNFQRSWSLMVNHHSVVGAVPDKRCFLPSKLFHVPRGCIFSWSSPPPKTTYQSTLFIDKQGCAVCRCVPRDRCMSRKPCRLHSGGLRVF